MRKHLLLLLSGVLLLACSDDNAPEDFDGWNMIFEEQFEGNFDQWNIWNGGAFNEEIQLYNESQLSLNNGIMTITATRQRATGATNPWDSSVKTFEYLSGRIESKMLFGPSDAEGES